MAIHFLNNVDYNQNQLFHPTIENQASDAAAGTPVDGQLYYNTSATPGLKVGENGSWVFVGGGVESITTANSDFVNLADTGTATVPILTASLSASGTPDSTVYLRGDNQWEPINAIPGTYTWTVSDGANSTAVASGETVTFSGTANEIEVAEASRLVTIGLPDDVTIGGNLTVTTALNMTIGQINNLANGTASGDAVNLGQVQGLIAGTGQFQGGYDATNDPGSPVISGSSNIALNTGDFYVVTVDGDITFSDQTISVEVGDLIFANTDITANSNPASTDYTFVIQDQNIAGEGATDAATEKGVAGFNSADFSVTANGFVELKATSKTGTITAGNLSGTVTHDFGVNTLVQTINSSGDTVYCDVTRTATTSVATISVVEATDITILVQKIG